MYERPVPPQNDTEWLMSNGVPPLDFGTEHRVAVLEALERASDEDRELLEAIFFERCSYRQLGRRLGTSHVHAWRLTQQALGRLRLPLLNDPAITERYDLGTTPGLE